MWQKVELGWVEQVVLVARPLQPAQQSAPLRRRQKLKQVAKVKRAYVRVSAPTVNLPKSLQIKYKKKLQQVYSKHDLLQLQVERKPVSLQPRLHQPFKLVKLQHRKKAVTANLNQKVVQRL